MLAKQTGSVNMERLAMLWQCKNVLDSLVLNIVIWYVISVHPMGCALNKDCSMSEELEVLKIVTERLNRANIPYMVSGSMAANYYTVPRMTRDIDIVIELKETDVDKFVDLFAGDFYINKEMIKKEVRRQGMFNLIHTQFVIKIDFIVKKSSPYQDTAFSRKREVLINSNPMWFISPEDLVISKLNWAKDSLSEMQLKDVRNLLETVDNLDLKYIDKWISQLDLKKVYKEAKQ